MRADSTFAAARGGTAACADHGLRSRVHDVLHVAVYVPKPFVPAG
jgi:hypothetical protein